MKPGLFASLGMLVMVAGVGCSSGPRNLCTERRVQCAAPETCDPTDGLCKCGGIGGVDCQEGFICDVNSTTCLSTVCGDITCGGGTACDITDNVCKCGGTGGQECGPSQFCNPALGRCEAALDCSTVTCESSAETCDPASGQCLCGEATCGEGETCVAGEAGATCAEDRCSGVSCVGASTCDAADGFCKCNGAICKGGEACECPSGTDGGCEDTSRVCRPGSACTNVTCGPGLTCDPGDGQCKCGGPGGPLCSTDQVCDLGPPPTCTGGEQCVNPDGTQKQCTGGTSCDPEDGLCKCGGRGGTVCKAQTETTAEEICVSGAFQQACRQRCNPTAPVCPSGQFCYFDSSSTSPDAYCIAPADPPKAEALGCNVPNECVSDGQGLHCSGLSTGASGICRPYCNTQVQGSCALDPELRPQNCIAIANGPANAGFCRP